MEGCCTAHAAAPLSAAGAKTATRAHHNRGVTVAAHVAATLANALQHNHAPAAKPSHRRHRTCSKQQKTFDCQSKQDDLAQTPQLGIHLSHSNHDKPGTLAALRACACRRRSSHQHAQLPYRLSEIRTRQWPTAWWRVLWPETELVVGPLLPRSHKSGSK